MADRSMVEPLLIEALCLYILRGTTQERQLANLAKDLIGIAGDDPRVIEYLNKSAAGVLDDRRVWD
jgi:hypothetical protein